MASFTSISLATSRVLRGRLTLARRAYATKTTTTTTTTTCSTDNKPFIDVSAYLKQNYQEPNYAAWGATAAGTQNHHQDLFSNMKNIFGDLDMAVDVTEYSIAKGMEPDYSAFRTAATSARTPPAPSTSRQILHQ